MHARARQTYITNIHLQLWWRRCAVPLQRMHLVAAIAKLYIAIALPALCERMQRLHCMPLYVFQSAFSIRCSALLSRACQYCQLCIFLFITLCACPCMPNLYYHAIFIYYCGGADARLDRNAHANLAAASYMGIARAM